MIQLWIDAMLSPALARWIRSEFPGVEATSAQRLDLLGVEDADIAEQARASGAVVLTKDADFADEVRRRGSPPVIWVQAGNTRTAAMKEILRQRLPEALDAIRSGRVLVVLDA